MGKGTAQRAQHLPAQQRRVKEKGAKERRGAPAPAHLDALRGAPRALVLARLAKACALLGRVLAHHLRTGRTLSL